MSFFLILSPSKIIKTNLDLSVFNRRMVAHDGILIGRARIVRSIVDVKMTREFSTRGENDG